MIYILNSSNICVNSDNAIAGNLNGINNTETNTDTAIISALKSLELSERIAIYQLIIRKYKEQENKK